MMQCRAFCWGGQCPVSVAIQATNTLYCILRKPCWFLLENKMICTISRQNKVAKYSSLTSAFWLSVGPILAGTGPTMNQHSSVETMPIIVWVIICHQISYSLFTSSMTIGIHDRQVLHNLNALMQSINLNFLQITPHRCNQLKKQKTHFQASL